MNWDSVAAFTTETLAAVGLQILGAIAVWVAGRWLIGLASRLLTAAMNRQQVEPTLTRYLTSAVTVALNIVLIVAILGYFGVETTSFAALLAAMGVAIGAAWAGLLANFAAGAFLMVLRPFKVGDFIRAAGIEGTVMEIGLFATTVMTPDNVASYVGNNSLFAGTIQNLSNSPTRRVDRTAQLAHGVDVGDAIHRLEAAVRAIPNVLAQPAPDVRILDFNAMGTLLAVRPYAHNKDYWQVYFDTNDAIAATFGEAHYPVPTTRQTVMRAGPESAAT